MRVTYLMGIRLLYECDSVLQPFLLQTISNHRSAMSASELSLAALLAQSDVENADAIAKLLLDKLKIKNVKMFANFFEGVV